MSLTQHIAKHLRDVHFGGNWTGVNLKQKLDGVTWQEANTKPGSFHSIATLIFHVNYYAEAILRVLDGGELDAKDKYSFDCLPLQSSEEWDQLIEKTFQNVERLACWVEQMPESQLWETFADEKYGTYYRNLQGIIEHNHYHLGQIAMVRAMVKPEK